MKYCSQCKRSQYVNRGHGYPRELRCDRHEVLGIRVTLPTDCTLAEMCPCFDPERWRDALTTQRKYNMKCSQCGIKPSEKNRGLLANVQLPLE